MRPPRRALGFTYIETMVALGIFFVVLALASPLLLTFHTSSLLSEAAEQITQDLRRAQSLSLAGVDDTNHGTFFDAAAEQWILFTGSTYSPGASTNEVHTLPSSVDLVSVSLAGGGGAVVFAERTGQTANQGSVVLRTGGRQITITVNAVGSVTRQ